MCNKNSEPAQHVKRFKTNFIKRPFEIKIKQHIAY